MTSTVLVSVGNHSMSLCCPLSSVSAEVRLVDGAGRCAGRLERKIQGNWRPEESDGNHDWNLTSAAAVCRQLDCGSVVSLRSIPTSSDGSDLLPIFTSIIFHVFYTSFWVEIICSGQSY